MLTRARSSWVGVLLSLGAAACAAEPERLVVTAGHRADAAVSATVSTAPDGAGDADAQGPTDTLDEADADTRARPDGATDTAEAVELDAITDADAGDDLDATPDTGPAPDTDGPPDTDAGGAPDVEESPPSCHVGAETGTCRPIGDCAADEAPIAGFCAGGPQVRCCLAAALDGCSALTAPGACLPTGACTGAFESTAGLCPGAADIRCCSAIGGATACDPGAAPTPNAGLVEAAGDPGCPAGMAAVTAATCVDRFEAALVRADAPDVSISPYPPLGGVPARAVSVRWAVPQGNISGIEAAAACAAAGKRLCTSAEWLRACRGPAGWTYPYGPTREPGRCNDARAVHPAIERFGTTASWIWSALDDACIAQLPAGLALTGEHPGCVSAEGVYDLMGNLHEWVSDADGTFRGGFYVDTTLNGPGCLYVTTAHNSAHHDYSTGFRCCADRAVR